MSGHTYYIEVDGQRIARTYHTLQGARRAARRLVPVGSRATVTGLATYGGAQAKYLTEVVRCAATHPNHPKQVFCDEDSGHRGEHFNSYFQRRWA